MNYMCDYGYASKTVTAKCHVRSHRVSSRSCYMPVDASQRWKPTDTIPSALSLLSRAVGKSAIDLKGAARLQLTSRAAARITTIGEVW